MKPKKIMIYAYTAHNLGDDLFIQLLCARYPSIQFYLHAPKAYRSTFKALTNLHIIPNDTTIQKIKQRIRSLPKTAVYIGGSLFIEQAGWEKQAKQLQRIRKRHEHFFIIGANFGPYESEAFHLTYERFFNKCDDVCFRDMLSYQLFNHLPQVRMANDVVFTQAVDSVNITKPTVVISVIYPSLRPSLAEYDDAYFTTIAQVTEASVEAGYEVVLMAFCKPEKDNQAIETITKKIATKHHAAISTFSYKTNIEAALETIAEAEIVIATRFHAMILAILYRKKIFAIIYSEKMLTVIDDNQFKIANCPIQNIQNIRTEKLLKEAFYVDTPLERLHQEAKEQFRMLDQHVAGNHP